MTCRTGEWQVLPGSLKSSGYTNVVSIERLAARVLLKIDLWWHIQALPGHIMGVANNYESVQPDSKPTEKPTDEPFRVPIHDWSQLIDRIAAQDFNQAGPFSILFSYLQ